MIIRLVSVLLVFVSMLSAAFAASPSMDNGKITSITVDSSGAMAISLDGGFPRATADRQCPVPVGWAGFANGADAALKSALLAAKATGVMVSIVTFGCTANGSWLGLSQVYIN